MDSLESASFTAKISRADGLRLIALAKPTLAVTVIAPNPANTAVEIAYSLGEAGLVEISLLNVRGEVVQVLKREVQSAGDHTLQSRVDSLPSGAYTVQIRAGGEIATRGIQVVR